MSTLGPTTTAEAIFEAARGSALLAFFTSTMPWRAPSRASSAASGVHTSLATVMEEIAEGGSK